MFGARRCWCAIASLLAQLAFAAPAFPSDSPIPVIVTTNTSDARLTRALVLIRGELSALGLDVQLRNVDAADPAPAAAESSSERLSLDVKEGAIVVRVFAAGAQAPVVESVELDGPEVTAEVIAVRAVEALRAARLLPSPPQRAAAPRPPATRSPAKPSPVEPPPSESPTIIASPLPAPLLELALGPTFTQNLQGLPQPAARASAAVGPRWGFLAVGGEASLAGLGFNRDSGSAQISRRALFLQLGARIRLHRAWGLNARAGISYLHYGAAGIAKPGYLAQDLEHSSGAVSLSLGGAYYFTRAVGAYLDVGGLAAFDAARVRLADESVVTLDQPSLAIGFGLLLGAF
jgi:hypothetical protein